MLVMKFGGSSVANADRIKLVADIIRQNLSKTPLVVVSAMGDTTDWLLEAGEKALSDQIDIEKILQLHQDTIATLGIEIADADSLLKELKNLVQGISLVKEISPHISNYLVSFGERLSARILAAYLKKLGSQAEAFDAWDVGFITEANNPTELTQNSSAVIAAKIEQITANKTTPIITGYIAKTTKGAIATLGRGGSDLTATFLGASLNAEEVQVWKDVNGILSADPRIVSETLEVKELSFEEACELAYFGSQVLHPRAIKPLLNKNTPVRVKNSYNPEHPGSIICSKPNDSTHPVKLITSKRDITMIDLVSTQMLGPHGYLAQLFQVFDRHKISVDLLASSDISVSMTLDCNLDLTEALVDLKKIAQVNVSDQKAIVSLIADVSKSSKILSETFSTLEAANINVQMLSQGCSKVKFSLVVDDSQATECVKILHQHFFN